MTRYSSGIIIAIIKLIVALEMFKGVRHTRVIVCVERFATSPDMPR
jgi:hypothetical protein